jgi:hypothetical protein
LLAGLSFDHLERVQLMVGRITAFEALQAQENRLDLVPKLMRKTGRLSDRAPTDKRRWGPSSDLPTREISQYIADSGSAEATIVASDEV